MTRYAMMLNALDRYRDAGLLLLRVGIGMSYMGYGAPKLSGGPPMWEELGQATRYGSTAWTRSCRDNADDIGIGAWSVGRPDVIIVSARSGRPPDA